MRSAVRHNIVDADQLIAVRERSRKNSREDILPSPIYTSALRQSTAQEGVQTRSRRSQTETKQSETDDSRLPRKTLTVATVRQASRPNDFLEALANSFTRGAVRAV